MQQIHTDTARPATWIKYKKSMCIECDACCCSLAVEVNAQDLIRMGFMDEFELQDNPKTIAKRLRKEGVIDHFHHKTGIFTLTRMANGDCCFLDPVRRRCTVYSTRPDTCRNHPAIGPRPGYCAFNNKLKH